MIEFVYVVAIIVFMYIVAPKIARSKWFEAIIFTEIYNPVCVVPSGKKLIHVWPDNFYCYPEDLWEYLWKSDDYSYSYVDEKLTDETIQRDIDSGRIK